MRCTVILKIEVKFVTLCSPSSTCHYLDLIYMLVSIFSNHGVHSTTCTRLSIFMAVTCSTRLEVQSLPFPSFARQTISLLYFCTKN